MTARYDQLATLASYVPALILRRLRDDPAPPSAPSSATFAAAAIFADISGFTQLAERLAQRGPIGVEELTRTLNTVFAVLIDHVHANGGEVVMFAGDALLALWPATAETLPTMTCAAAQCARTIHRQVQILQSLITQVPLTLRVGVGAGDVIMQQLGGARGRWETLFTGAALTCTHIAASQAQPGEVIVAPQAWAAVRDRCQGTLLPAGGTLLGAVHAPVGVNPPIRPLLPPAAAESLAGYLPAALSQRGDNRQPNWIAELRRITVLFVSLPDLDLDLERNQTVLSALQAALYRYEGSVNKISVDEKGVMLVAAFGLPPLAHEDDAVRGVRAALDVQQVLRELGVRYAIGVSSGRAFCGAIGSDLRREYTMLGDIVNLAARLMQAAPQTIRCDTATVRATQQVLAFDACPALKLKGKAAPVANYAPKTAALAHAAPVALAPDLVVGRAAELEALITQLQLVRNDWQSRLVVIEGDAGMGKSCLLASLREQAAAQGITMFTGSAASIERSTLYYAWREVFSQMFDLNILTDNDARRRHMLDLLEDEPDILAQAALLNAVLPLDLPESAETRDYDGAARAEKTRELLLTCLRASTERSPKIIVLDDGHWFDSASWTLLALVMARIPRLLLVVATRPLPNTIPADAARLLHAPATHWLRLASLSLDDTRTLLCERLGVATLPEEAVSLIWGKAQGNPFFSEELAYALRERDVLHIADGRAQLATSAGELHILTLPDTVQGVITSRVDRLTPPQQLTLKAASVIGTTFSHRILQEVYPLANERLNLNSYMHVIEEHDLALLDTPEPNLAYRFKHVITQQVIYDLMLFAQRRTLHQGVARWYERAGVEDLSPHYLLLAHHWQQAGDTERAITYIERAGLHALQLCAYREAQSCLAQALVLSETLDPPDPARQTALYERLGEICWYQGDSTSAAEYLQTGLALARRHQQRARIATTLSLLARAVEELGDHEAEERYLEESLTIATELDDRPALVNTLRNLGNAALLRGDNAHALMRWRESLELAIEIGDRNGMLAARGNIGWGYMVDQQYTKARTHLYDALDMAREMGDQWMISDTLTSLALATIEDQPSAEELHAARARLREALSTAQQVGSLNKMLYALAGWAALLAAESQPEQALEMAALVLARATGGGDLWLIATRVRDALHAALPADVATAALARGAAHDLSAIVRAIVEAG